jgi:hypothetical protein
VTDPSADLDYLRDRCFLVAAPLRMTDLYGWRELLTILAVMRVGEFVTLERVPDYRRLPR